jgi:hypothetical protein
MMPDAPAKGEVGAVPAHPRVSDAIARAMLEALLDSPSIGIALVCSKDWSHVMTSAAYERLVAAPAALGRPLYEVLPESIASRAKLEAVVATGDAATTVLERTNAVGASPMPMHVRFTFLAVPRVTPDSDGLLVLAQDVSREVHEQRIGELFVALANDMSAERDETATIRSSVAHASEALGADEASLFLLSPDGARLHGALVGWDWTRTSFVAELEYWPNVRETIAANETSFMTARTARLAEEVWFERRGIKAAICAPMAVDRRVLGVLFFDYSTPPTRVDLRLAKSIADQCALLVERAARVA